MLSSKQKKVIDTLLPMVEETEKTIAKAVKIINSYRVLTGKEIILQDVISYIVKW